ncbi:hypothetical protein BO71DRAFT_219421 [Aspergillus ellipticus CBS 707.79]|uniref:Uncharacterized protein n=1 Tax=Aspergillus ellipticus CBS 707.79 TaxID=1448320 RepID=A0A319DU49_9EURO|nr:hypothetical protein BO71DRAFT_219421 [Aspergillus ellipticus CBS 707.79]
MNCPGCRKGPRSGSAAPRPGIPPCGRQMRLLRLIVALSPALTPAIIALDVDSSRVTFPPPDRPPLSAVGIHPALGDEPGHRPVPSIPSAHDLFAAAGRRETGDGYYVVSKGTCKTSLTSVDGGPSSDCFVGSPMLPGLLSIPDPGSSRKLITTSIRRTRPPFKVGIETNEQRWKLGMIEPSNEIALPLSRPMSTSSKASAPLPRHRRRSQNKERRSNSVDRPPASSARSVGRWC